MSEIIKIHPDNPNFVHLDAIYGNRTIQDCLDTKYYGLVKIKCDICLKDIEGYWMIQDPHSMFHVCSECVEKGKTKK